jgi:cysteine desulfurase family protein (TIGR01976 family)
MYPLHFIRKQYPALQKGDTIYLDNAAGAQVPQQVVDNMVEALTTMQVNQGGLYKASERITAIKSEVRALTAKFVNATSPDNVQFGPNTTTLNELLAQSVGRWLKPGDEIIITALDHHSNRDPWRRLELQGISVKTWQTKAPHHTLELSDLQALLTAKTKLVCMTAASNALGTLTPIKDVSKIVHAHGAKPYGTKLSVDSVHYAPHFLPDVQAMGVDMMVFSPYKVFGPHLGVLYLSDEMRDTLTGPGLEFFPKADPVNWEPGTQNHEGIHAWGGTFRYFDDLSKEMKLGGSERERWQKLFDAFREHETKLGQQLIDGLNNLGATVYGLPSIAGRTATVSVNLRDLLAEDVATHLGNNGVAVANGHYYAYNLIMKTLGLAERGGAVRISLLHYSNQEDVEAVLRVLGNL